MTKSGDVWDTVDLGQGWVAAYRLIEQGGHPVIAEMHVYARAAMPREPQLSPRRSPKVDRELPVGGIRSSVLRRASVATILKRTRKELRESADQTVRGVPIGEKIFDRLEEQPPKPTGRRRQDPQFYAEVAELYATAIAEGERKPIVAVTRHLESQGKPYAESYIRSAVQEARRRSFLTPSTKGRAGGELTPLGRQMLHHHAR